MSDDRERTVRSRVSDPNLLDALEAAEEGSTMADVLRECMESHLLDDGVSEDVSGLSQVARRGLRSLRKNIDGATGMVEVSTAESQIANACNIPKETVRPSVFEPLRRHGRIGLHHTVEHVFIVVEAPEPVEGPQGVTAGVGGYQTLEEPFECANCSEEIDAVHVLAPVESISVDAEIICGMCGRESGERVMKYV